MLFRDLTVLGASAVVGALQIGLFFSDPQAEIGSDISWEESRSYVRPLLEEDGLQFSFPLTVWDLEDSTVPVEMWLVHDGSYLVSRAEILIPYDATRWDNFLLFVPYSKLYPHYKFGRFRIFHGEGWRIDAGIHVLVRSLDKDDAYIAESPLTGFRINNRHIGDLIKVPSIVWEWKSLTEGPDALEVTLNVNMNEGVRTKLFSAGLILRNLQGQELVDKQGRPLRFDNLFRLEKSHDRSIWEDITIKVPYDYLDHIPPTQEVILTPAIRPVGENTLIEGNIHVHFKAGGSAERQQRKLEELVHQLDNQIDYLEKRLKILGKD